MERPAEDVMHIVTTGAGPSAPPSEPPAAKKKKRFIVEPQVLNAAFEFDQGLDTGVFHQ